MSGQAPVPIPSEQHRRQVCRYGQGAGCCCFLASGVGRWMCLKGSNLALSVLARKPGMFAQGDNCSGPPDFTPTLPPRE